MTEEVETEAPEGYLQGREGFGYLPPLHRVKLPKTNTQTALVRWLAAVGYSTKDISNGLNVRYQQVRNMITTVPKRAAREDLPPLTIELAEMEDVVDMLLGQELERTHLEASKKAKRQKPVPKDGKPKGMHRSLTEDDEDNEDLDDENYGRM